MTTPDWDVTPRAARRLRTFGRPDAPDESDVPWASIETMPGEPDDPAPDHPSMWDRRKQHRPDPEAIDIGDESSHAWWAQRENLELLVNPKKRGAAARARRAAQEAFAPPGVRTRPSGAADPVGTSGGTWDPSAVFSWVSDTAPGEPATEARAPEPTPVATPWDVLGLTSDASWDEVSRRHKQLAKTHHPDRHGSSDPDARRVAEQRMSEINAAHSDLRRIYRLTDGT